MSLSKIIAGINLVFVVNSYVTLFLQQHHVMKLLINLTMENLHALENKKTILVLLLVRKVMN